MTAAMYDDPEGRALVAAIHERKRKTAMTTSDQLAAIEARREGIGCVEHSDCLRADAAYLLALVREQAAKLDVVRGIATRLDASPQVEDHEIAQDLRAPLDAS